MKSLRNCAKVLDNDWKFWQFTQLYFPLWIQQNLCVEKSTKKQIEFYFLFVFLKIIIYFFYSVIKHIMLVSGIIWGGIQQLIQLTVNWEINCELSTLFKLQQKQIFMVNTKFSNFCQIFKKNFLKQQKQV